MISTARTNIIGTYGSEELMCFIAEQSMHATETTAMVIAQFLSKRNIFTSAFVKFVFFILSPIRL